MTICGGGESSSAEATRYGSAAEIFRVFLKLGLTSFGGPIAHLGYFRQELVLRRRWIDEAGYADLVALCQFLPGPASSQVGFSLGILRFGGLLGGLIAFAAFTLPSALLLSICALVATTFTGAWAEGLLHGLKLVAVAVVAQAVWGMARALVPDRPRAAILLVAVMITAIFGGSAGQIASLAVGALAGLILCRRHEGTSSAALHLPVSRRQGAGALLLFAICLAGPPLLASFAGSFMLVLFDAFYRAGALVFGGGHVVLPLLRTAVVAPGWVSNDAFLAGYGLAQAVPGPLFTFAAYLGAVMASGSQPLLGALVALIAIFLPGLLLVYGILPFWDALRQRPAAQAAMRGTNAAVVGILAMALYDPVWTAAVFSTRDLALALAAFLLLAAWQAPPWIVVLLLASSGVLLAVM